MIRQYINCEDITELLKLLCCTHSIALTYSKFSFSWQNVLKFTIRGNHLTVSLYHIKFSYCKFFDNLKTDCNLWGQRTCKNLRKFHDCYDEMAKHNLWGQWNLWLQNPIHFNNVQHNQMIPKLWGHETLRLNKTQFAGTENTVITKSPPVLLFKRWLNNIQLVRHHRYLETIMLHTFNRSRLLKNKRAFVTFIDYQKLLNRSLNRQVLVTFSWWNVLKFSFSNEPVYNFYIWHKVFSL